MGKLEDLYRESSQKLPGELVASDEFLSTAAPLLQEFLARPVLGDKPRELGSLSIFAEEGRWKVCLSCRETGRCAFRSFDGLENLFSEIGSWLESGDVEWRLSKKRRFSS